jgi:hypothetical protein
MGQTTRPLREQARDLRALPCTAVPLPLAPARKLGLRQESRECTLLNFALGRALARGHSGFFSKGNTVEHRWGNRLPSEHLVRIRTRGGLMASGVLHNVSVSGALLETTAPLRTSAYIDVQIFPPHYDSAVAAAYVVRAQGPSFGIEWCELAPAGVQRLLASLTPPPGSDAAIPAAARTTRASGR